MPRTPCSCPAGPDRRRAASASTPGSSRALRSPWGSTRSSSRCTTIPCARPATGRARSRSPTSRRSSTRSSRMTRSRADGEHRGRGRLALLCVAALVACHGAGPDPAPARAALALFELARAGEPSEGSLLALFEDVPRDEAGRAALFDVLETLGRAAPPRVERVTASDGEADAFVDLVVVLPGEGEARYSVRLVDVSGGA